MENNYLQIFSLWKKGTTLTLGLGLLSGGMSTQAATDCNAVTEISTIECESLLELHHSTNGAKWKKSEGWNVTNTPCSWHGVTCENGDVITINIYYNQLTGTIPDFSALPNLQMLSLGGNQLTGTIPDFSALPNLQTLYLSGNQLTGPIPDFSALPNLQTLYLSDNQLTGTIPDFSALPNLETLYLSDNQLEVIPDFSNMPKLHSYSYGFTTANQLTLVDINCNAITEISKIECESLLELYYSTNGPEWLFNEGWNVTNTPCSWYGITCENSGVTGIFFKSNQLTGEIPDFSGLPNLQTLYLWINQLTGTIPDFSALPNLQTLYLYDNKLTGEIPDFSALPKLEELNLSYNEVTGEIPDFSALPNLEMLNLSYNELTGEIPDFSALPNLYRLNLSDNQLMGKIPDFSNLLNLRHFSFSGNQLLAPMDISCNDVTEISTIECESLLELYYSTNGIDWGNDEWNITDTPCKWSGITCENGSVTRIYLNNIQLTGTIPDFSALPNLQTLNLSSNQLTGTIPDFSALPKLEELSLSNNQLTGAIPNFSALLNLHTLELFGNQLIGTIPNFSALPQLESFSFSGNQLTLMDTNCNVVTQTSKIECESLLELYHSTNGTEWENNEGWNITNTPCLWYGVTCENGGVTKIDLSGYEYRGFSTSNNLNGTIPNFKGLPNLQVLNLKLSNLTGTIPDFSALPNLQSLNLSKNQLTGTIPDFSALPKLKFFGFSGNQLTLMDTNCNVITKISKIECESLLELYHSTNGANWGDYYIWWSDRGTEGWNVTNMPCSWYGITCENGGVTKIALSNNQLSGVIPDFSGLPNLQILELSANQLTGAIPDFSGLPNLQTLEFYGNQLTGTIPNFSALPNLQTLELHGNQLTGVIPDFTALPNLQTLNLRFNQLTGAIPDFIALPELYTLDLSVNQLTGTIPDFSALPNLQKLYLDSNQLTGVTPEFNALPNLQYFSFSGNQLTLNCNAVTEIPIIECESLLELYHNTNGTKWEYDSYYMGLDAGSEEWNVTNTPCSWYGVTCENGSVTEIHIYSSNRIGMIPDFSTLPNLKLLSLSNNQLTGTIPDFNALPDLQTLKLSSNQLTGAIPDFSALPKLQWLVLSFNQLTGAIPDFSALPNLEWLRLSSNQLTSAIPDFSALPNLQTIELSNNQLTGAIPDFSALPNLQRFILSDNQLTGAIPNFSALPNLQTLSLHENQLCKDTNINYSSWQEELNAFPNCPVSPLSATVKMQLNQSRYTTSNPLHLDMQVNGQAMIDLYVAIVFPSGHFMTIAYPLALSQLNAIQIYQPAVEIVGQKTYPIIDISLPAGITAGGYQACGVLVLAGAEPMDTNNWIDSHCAGFEVY
jgi:Leucine-rich repeat (LRR) protein